MKLVILKRKIMIAQQVKPDTANQMIKNIILGRKISVDKAVNTSHNNINR